MRWLLCLLLLTSPAWAVRSLKADLDGDGRDEVVRLVEYEVDGVTLGQLVVEAQGKVLWRGPRSKQAYNEEPFRFLGEFDGGDLIFLADYDHDGKVDLVASDQKSDVRPTVYRLFHWNGQKFVFDRRAMLVPQPQKPATYNWEKPDPSRTVWVETIRVLDGQAFELQVTNLGHEAYALKTRWLAGEGFVLSE
ncbi:MAG: VCBS repeat-containing protein [Candidatus Eremiobacteraeota bacterium]|nr:VCBS repeat-containing protein [Candidatus Eremiobacteraeota bacterium]